MIKLDEQYAITAPTFQTSSPKYAWLNEIQALGKPIALNDRSGRLIQYDVFAIREALPFAI